MVEEKGVSWHQGLRELCLLSGEKLLLGFSLTKRRIKCDPEADLQLPSKK